MSSCQHTWDMKLPQREQGNHQHEKEALKVKPLPHWNLAFYSEEVWHSVRPHLRTQGTHWTFPMITGVSNIIFNLTLTRSRTSAPAILLNRSVSPTSRHQLCLGLSAFISESVLRDLERQYLLSCWSGLSLWTPLFDNELCSGLSFSISESGCLWSSLCYTSPLTPPTDPHVCWLRVENLLPLSTAAPPIWFCVWPCFPLFWPFLFLFLPAFCNASGSYPCPYPQRRSPYP